MIRRVHIAQLGVGDLALPAAEAHHVRDVLRMNEGDVLELFDRDGNVATAVIKTVNPAHVVVVVETLASAAPSPRVVVAAAVPKGDRADWMIEKLSELGVAQFIPLAAERSVTLPGGTNKLARWERIAVEAAKQSRRIGTMQIAPLTPLPVVIQSARPGWFLSTAQDAISVDTALVDYHGHDHTLLIGPEGGWTESEISHMRGIGLVAVSLTRSILRVETAAVLAAGVLLCRQ
jgi:16S rRNA (uracil1498-N3)-methyltransferase